MTTAQLVTVIVAIIGSGGLVGAVVALLKLRPESGQIVVTAAQGALVVQSGVIETLREEIGILRAENARLRERLTAQEQQLAELRAEVHEDRE